MARTVKDANLDSRTARGRLAMRSKPYYRLIDQGCHLGYYKGKRGGRWLARYFLGEGQYAQTTLGTADDIRDANGKDVLSFAQAQAAAREFFDRKASGEPDDEPDPEGPYTVRRAVADYLENYESEGGKAVRDATLRADAFILPDLGDVAISRLTKTRIRKWHQALAKTPPRVRTRRGKAQQFRDTADDPEALRRRRSSANRVLTILKAALNFAFEERDDITSDIAWRKVKPFKQVEVARVRYLEFAEVTALIGAAPADLAQLIRGAVATGCRYGELVQMRARDFDAANGMVHVPESKSGAARWVVLTAEGVRTFKALARGKAAGDLIFAKADGSQWGRSHQTRPLLEANKGAMIDPPADFHCLRHTYASHAVMGGMALIVLAKNLGHKDTRMVEKHYGHLADEWTRKQIRKTAPQFEGRGKVVKLRPAG